jgi:hypothetical protein
MKPNLNARPGRAAALLLTVAGLLALLPAASAAGHPHTRDGWLAGLAYGYGRGRVQPFDDSSTYSFRNGVTPQIRLGRMVHPHLALQFEYGGWMYEEGGDLEVIPLKARVSMQNAVLAATWYPGSRDNAWGGLYLRAGAGVGWASFGLVVITEEGEEGAKARLDESGFGVQAALGYEWRFARRTAAGLNIGVQHLDIGGAIYDKTTWVPVTMSLAWYWD